MGEGREWRRILLANHQPQSVFMLVRYVREGGWTELSAFLNLRSNWMVFKVDIAHVNFLYPPIS